MMYTDEVSFGTQGLIQGLGSDSRPRGVNTILINILTLLRSNYENRLAATDIEDKVLSDANFILDFLSTVVFDTNVKGKCIFYHIPYDKLKSSYLKKSLPLALQRCLKLIDAVMLKLTDNLESRDNVDTYVVSQDPEETSLTSALTKVLDRVGVLRTTAHAILVSHNPIDFHVHSFFNKFCVLESYKGTYVGRANLGKKVFGNTDIPFTPDLHLLLGDKLFLRRQAGIKLKKTILAKAKEDRWFLLTPDEVKEALDKIENIPEYK